MIEHLTKVKNILMIPKAYLRDKKHNRKVVRDIVLFLMNLAKLIRDGHKNMGTSH
jgi:hypothetical protein